MAVAGFIGAAAAVLLVSLTMRDSAEFGALGLALGGAMLAYPLGVIGGLFVLRRALKMPGSIVFGVVGAIVGAALAVGLANFVNRSPDPGIAVVLYFILVPALASVGLRMGDGRSPRAVRTRKSPDAK